MNVEEAMKQIAIANVLWARAKAAEFLGDQQEADRLQEAYRDRLRQILENIER